MFVKCSDKAFSADHHEISLSNLLFGGLVSIVRCVYSKGPRIWRMHMWGRFIWHGANRPNCRNFDLRGAPRLNPSSWGQTYCSQTHSQTFSLPLASATRLSFICLSFATLLGTLDISFPISNFHPLTCNCHSFIFYLLHCWAGLMSTFQFSLPKSQ